MRELKHGDVIYFVGHNHWHKDGYVQVCKIGTKWVYVRYPTSKEANYRIDKKTWVADGGSGTPRGRCYLSKGEYESGVELQELHRRLVSHLSTCFSPRAGVTRSDIQQAASLLNIQLNNGE